MEVEVLRERTIDGLKAARARGKKGGRKPGSYYKDRALSASALYQNGIPINQILKIAQIKSKATLYEYLRREEVFKLNV